MTKAPPEEQALYVGTLGEYELIPGKTGLLVIDMQYSSTHKDYGWKRMYRQMGLDSIGTYSLDRVDNLVIPNIQALLKACREQGLPIIYTTVSSEKEDYSDLTARSRRHIAEWTEKGFSHPYCHVWDAGAKVIEELAPRPGEPVINKTRFSAFNGSDIDQVLKEMNLELLLFTGVGTNYCVQCTLFDAYDLGYECILVEDATSTLAQDLQDTAIRSMAPYAKISSTQQLLEQISGGNG
jgi:biuret amidohydrolase